MRNKNLVLSTLSLLTIAISSELAPNWVACAQQPRAVNKVIKSGGWALPDVSQSAVVVPRQLQKRATQDSVPVYVTGFKPAEDVKFEIDFFVIADDGQTLSLGQRTFLVRTVMKYDVDGRVFCYVLKVVNMFIGKETIAYGGETILFFYDDGDGSFEAFQQSGKSEDFAPRLPKWLTTKK